MGTVAIIGAGLAGCECARVLAARGIASTVFESKPGVKSMAHVSNDLSELVCSNSLRSDALASGIGLLKQELRDMGSPFMRDADASRVPAGKALAVDRSLFSGLVTRSVRENPLITLKEACISSLDDPLLAGFDHIVLAAGPLAAESLSESLARTVGMDHCYFYDAIAPIVWGHSLNMEIVFRGSRYGDEHAGESGGTDEGDYLNCPMNRDEYTVFYEALLAAEKVRGRDFEKERHFEGCMPIEALAERGPKTLVFGPMKPVGFTDPRTGRRPWAILQLRTESLNGETFNLVGCQTKLTYPEQARVFRLVPGLEKAEFVRYGSMHRNTYINSPKVLSPDGSLAARPDVFPAGQISGVEGYVESAAHGHWVALTLAARLQGRTLDRPPVTTALGALLGHLSGEQKRFQPSNAHFGLMPEPEHRVPKKERKEWYAARARADFAAWLAAQTRS
ncbi:MAG: methylenetetrahydrofolate--tRNA-(uracil(54)-C(5))-methyltransferase (FADH(2)-oxidizing) TrmFO [Desulfovibrionaceae bacterium]|nr:methylenetetrahydrofolate--tRNA-(uracil(54)-C(5))-methyltransferase (FADH(2)-oxidizing) TrmFO [Desulfovibrionaceae bacterium]